MTTALTDAEAHFESGRFAEALVAWQAMADADPSSIRALVRVGTCLIALGRSAEAVAILEDAVERAPEQPVAHYRLAIAQARCGDDDAALASLDKAASTGLRSASGIDDEPAFVRLRLRARFADVRARVAHNDRPTADDPRYRNFDFWVGDWEARSPDGVLHGHNRIEIVLDGAAIVENWTGLNGYRGTSLNHYDRHSDRWRQTWVDDQGDIIEFVDGRFADGELTFIADDPAGGRRRLTFSDHGSDAFRQLSERTDDDGASWSVEYDFRYRRVVDPPADTPR
jgi:tetratricopeptide (TPR) repeat protein